MAQPAAVAAPSSSTPSSVASTGDLSVGFEADGQVLTLQVGQRVTVTLTSGWTAPRALTTSTDAGPSLQPLRTDQATGFPTPGEASATFTAVRVGQGLVAASTDAQCLHTTPSCAMAQREFQVSVQVQPRAGQGAGPLPLPAH